MDASDGGLSTPLQDLDWSPASAPSPSLVVHDCLAAGMFSVHHLGLAHGGGPNHSLDRRIGFNVTCVRAISCAPPRPPMGCTVGTSDCVCCHASHGVHCAAAG
jgi:hypothetical protein